MFQRLHMANDSEKMRWCFLDMDGVLVKDKGHIHKIEDMEILPRAIEGLQMLRDSGFRFIIVTNQAGIAKGFFKHEDAHAFNEELARRLVEKGIVIEATYMCPHHPNHTGDCLCRKPGTGMLEEAARSFSIRKENAVLIGDKGSDIEAGKRWGCKTVWIRNSQYPDSGKADVEADDLAEAARVI